MGLEKDLPPGEQLLELFRPFLEYLAVSDLSPTTIQKHVDNLWALGGEFIRDLHNDPSLRKKPVDRVLSQMIEYGGPLLYQHISMPVSGGAHCEKRRRGPRLAAFWRDSPNMKRTRDMPSREALGLNYFPSTLNLLSTENTPLTVFARIPARSLSPCDATTPTSVTCPLATMM